MDVCRSRRAKVQSPKSAKNDATEASSALLGLKGSMRYSNGLRMLRGHIIGMADEGYKAGSFRHGIRATSIRTALNILEIV